MPFGPTVLGAQPAADCVVNLQKNAILSHKVKKCRRMPMPKSRTHIIGISLCAGLLRASLRFLESFYVPTFKRNVFRNLEYLMTNKIPEYFYLNSGEAYRKKQKARSVTYFLPILSALNFCNFQYFIEIIS